LSVIETGRQHKGGTKALILLPDMEDTEMERRDAPRNMLANLRSQLGLLAVLAILVAAFVMFGGLRIEIALIGFALFTGLVALRPAPIAPALPETRRVVLDSPPRGADEEQMLAAMAEALGDPAMVLDQRGAVVFRNGAAIRQYPNIADDQILSLVLRDPQLLSAIEGALRDGALFSFELHQTIPNETWDRVVVAPLRLPGTDWSVASQRRLLVTFQSLTALKRVDAMRSDFIANASHELRTPLASLIGFIDTLLGPAAKDAAAREKFLGIMRGQADRMSRLIDDLLSLSRIEMYQHMRPTGTVELAGLLREVREGLQTQAAAAELQVELRLPDGPVSVTGDRSQLYEVFENLIENAIKYGAGGKSVEVELARIDRGGLHHMVSVIDHGPGVPPEHVPRMTERFYRIDAETSRKKKGTGLGLAIVKHIVQRHRGQVSIRSKLGEGLRVDVLLP
jgi:two-component system phosphate regulon sensor histidine kinase PhoR